ncbi:MAG: preprotein translocase subunit YajC [Candidatus Omnitrophota bacterium]|nr:preprotein translocase subunit YajC [Candidatus Omnitrophota bacterium]MBU1895142.1 preprotein translocase subunit YajC [Candidatus Omnitrophota bacterium]
MLGLAFAQTGSAGASGSCPTSSLMGLMPIAVIFIIFYFLLIRPQKKSQKEHAKMISELTKNDEVVTSGGIYGTIVNIQNDVVTLRVDDNTRIKIQRSSVSKLKKPKIAEKEK